MKAFLIYDTGPPSLPGSSRPSSKGQEPGCKIASDRGERLNRAYPSKSLTASQDVKEPHARRI